MELENMIKTIILVVGWPVLVIMSFVIIKRAKSYYFKLKENVIGKLIVPTVFGWLYGMYMLGIVSTGYMLGWPWFYSVIPAFASFMIAIFIVYKAINTWERQATELKSFYKDLERLVAKRTKELEKAHDEAIKHEKEIQKLKDQFVFIAAHELKTPVTAIRWGIEMALEDGKKLDPKLAEQLKSVQVSNQRLITLVDDLLNVARIEAGTIKIDPEKMDIDGSIKSTIKEMKTVFREKDISVEYNSSGSSTVYADPARVKQVLINLLSNATKYNKKGGKITIKLEDKDKFVKVSVKDTGIGIKEKDLKVLFTKFGRVDDKKTEDVEGTGLGLFLSKEIVTKQGGEIEVESEYGSGSVFSFTVPKDKVNQANS